jgi:hypothetical protein
MKDRLIELLDSCYVEKVECYPNGIPAISYTKKAVDRGVIYKLADYLLANGVIVPPCKVGDTVYYIGGIHHSLVKSAIVEEIIMNCNGVSDLLVTSENNVVFENSIELFYITKEEAEKALKGGGEE